ncbi:MAG: hypothetical protein E7A24_08785 [Varibaculum cambriense]|uniref:hypothetical protein n=1 Tax=uncultured Varibaculum sp. TaxID=413896 RepID=UPI002588ADF9|nr:hypothetical protein [uncultured Varibaculum sp.]MDU1052267.1 hypothetical protein [Varibaculum cambriense]
MDIANSTFACESTDPALSTIIALVLVVEESTAITKLPMLIEPPRSNAYKGDFTWPWLRITGYG